MRRARIVAPMSGDPEAASNIVTGGIIAATVEAHRAGNAQAEAAPHGAPVENCRNCGAALTGAYCAACGQSRHVHRSFSAIFHDVLHGAFHFDSKFWRTLPELIFHPGRLTRRYIDGERAKFISPLALYLFTVFAMFAVVGMSGLFSSAPALGEHTDQFAQQWREGHAEAMAQSARDILELRKQREDASLSPAQRAAIDAQIADIETSQQVLEALSQGDIARLAELNRARTQEGAAADDRAEDPSSPGAARLKSVIAAVQANPQLALYKLKTNAYKFSWMIIPLSLPFLWLLFCWRRDVYLYDHAIFATYSISFMMLFAIAVSLLASLVAWPWSAIVVGSLCIVPPLHMYKQLRGTYRASRFGAAWRLIALIAVTTAVLTLFALIVMMIAGIG
jgi:hypothetical protein